MTPTPSSVQRRMGSTDISNKNKNLRVVVEIRSESISNHFLVSHAHKIQDSLGKVILRLF